MKEITKEDGKRYYTCEECGLLYKKKEWALKCEAWCSAHDS